MRLCVGTKPVQKRGANVCFQNPIFWTAIRMCPLRLEASLAPRHYLKASRSCPLAEIVKRKNVNS